MQSYAIIKKTSALFHPYKCLCLSNSRLTMLHVLITCRWAFLPSSSPNNDEPVVWKEFPSPKTNIVNQVKEWPHFFSFRHSLSRQGTYLPPRRPPSLPLSLPHCFPSAWQWCWHFLMTLLAKTTTSQVATFYYYAVLTYFVCIQARVNTLDSGGSTWTLTSHNVCHFHHTVRRQIMLKACSYCILFSSIFFWSTYFS